MTHSVLTSSSLHNKVKTKLTTINLHYFQVHTFQKHPILWDGSCVCGRSPPACLALWGQNAGKLGIPALGREGKEGIGGDGDSHPNQRAAGSNWAMQHPENRESLISLEHLYRASKTVAYHTKGVIFNVYLNLHGHSYFLVSRYSGMCLCIGLHCLNVQVVKS